ncbi:tetratricopeptide repeat protein 9C [Bombina bombina]|uniref:tetratricopeptide repeat protein 9C n=1 Tax=Bombina bombina TaxID=8345 RepID=UPI00235AA177|nr:tetratricopeptide repeat protein 9C [Bombina bombina]
MAEQLGTIGERLKLAGSLKVQGNKCYAERRLREAIGLYHRALLQLRSLDPQLPSPLPGLGSGVAKLTSEQLESLQALQADCCNNLAACLLLAQPPRYQRVYELSVQVLNLQPHNIKALYRGGVSSYHLQDYTRAHSYLSQAASQKPKDTNIQRYLQLTNTALRASHAEEKQRYQGMFD